MRKSGLTIAYRTGACRAGTTVLLIDTVNPPPRSSPSRI
jgi:hypothetical protein